MTSSPAEVGDGERTTVRRLPEKQVEDRAVLDAVLDSALVGHLAVVDDGQPYVLPVGFARDGDRVLVHGSTASRLFRALAAGVPTCFTVTALDGVVVARSAFESSMHYRSAMVLGRCSVVADDDAKLAALETLTEHLIPGRWADVRAPLRKELAATMVLALPIEEWSVKVSDGQPDDGPEDVAGSAWAGIIPLTESWGEPVAADDLADGIALPAYLRR